jgi:hypothetical protein
MAAAGCGEPNVRRLPSRRRDMVRPVVFSIDSMVRFGWEAFKRRAWFFVGASVVMALLYGAIGLVSGTIDGALTHGGDRTTVLGSVVSIGLSILLSMGVTAFYLNVYDHPDQADLTALWHPQNFWSYVGVSILLSVVVGIGFLLLIVPGIILSLMFMFATFIVVDRGLDPFAAMKQSRQITAGYKWQLFLFSLVLMLINLLGALAVVVGLFVSVPVTWLALVHAYRSLAQNAGVRPAGAIAKDASL